MSAVSGRFEAVAALEEWISTLQFSYVGGGNAGTQQQQLAPQQVYEVSNRQDVEELRFQHIETSSSNQHDIAAEQQQQQRNNGCKTPPPLSLAEQLVEALVRLLQTGMRPGLRGAFEVVKILDRLPEYVLVPVSTVSFSTSHLGHVSAWYRSEDEIDADAEGAKRTNNWSGYDFVPVSMKSIRGALFLVNSKAAEAAEEEEQSSPSPSPSPLPSSQQLPQPVKRESSSSSTMCKSPGAQVRMFLRLCLQQRILLMVLELLLGVLKANQGLLGEFLYIHRAASPLLDDAAFHAVFDMVRKFGGPPLIVRAAAQQSSLSIGPLLESPWDPVECGAESPIIASWSMWFAQKGLRLRWKLEYSLGTDNAHPVYLPEQVFSNDLFNSGGGGGGGGGSSSAGSRRSAINSVRSGTGGVGGGGSLLASSLNAAGSSGVYDTDSSSSASGNYGGGYGGAVGGGVVTSGNGSLAPPYDNEDDRNSVGGGTSVAGGRRVIRKIVRKRAGTVAIVGTNKATANSPALTPSTPPTGAATTTVTTTVVASPSSSVSSSLMSNTTGTLGRSHSLFASVSEVQAQSPPARTTRQSSIDESALNSFSNVTQQQQQQQQQSLQSNGGTNGNSKSEVTAHHAVVVTAAEVAAAAQEIADKAKNELQFVDDAIQKRKTEAQHHRREVVSELVQPMLESYAALVYAKWSACLTNNALSERRVMECHDRDANMALIVPRLFPKREGSVASAAAAAAAASSSSSSSHPINVTVSGHNFLATHHGHHSDDEEALPARKV